MPDRWITGIHQWLGLGEFPDRPIAFYLARSTSAMYALHGALFICMSSDVQRYRPLIRLLACCMMVMGGGLIATDVCSGLPVWWILIEGPFAVVFGALLLFLLGKVKTATPSHLQVLSATAKVRSGQEW